MSKIIFQKTGMSDLTLENGRLVPFSPDEIEINQDKYLTESNNAKIIVYGANLELLKLKFKNLPKDNYDGSINGLKTWFSNSIINWLANSFTLLDENGISYTVRLWQNKFKTIKSSNERYVIELLLKKE